MACPIGFAATMGPRLADRASGACRPWPCGGSVWASCLSASIRGTPSRTGRTNNFTGSLKPTRHGRPRPPQPRRLPPLEYPGHVEIRRVDQNGYVSWRRPLFVSVALADEAIAFEEVDDGIWTSTFATVVLGRFDERQHKIHPIAALSLGRSASSAG